MSEASLEEEMRCKARFVLIGPSGWLAQAFLTELAKLIGPGWREHVACFGSSARTIRVPSGGVLPVRKLSDLSEADVEGAIVLHLAFQGLERVADLPASAFAQANLEIDEAVDRALEGGDARALFVSSSGMAREAASGTNRNLYGLCKLMQEERFLSRAAKSPCRTLVGRIFNIAGPYANKLHSYALTSFLLQGMEVGRVRVSAALPVFRSYLHVRDLVRLVLMELTDDRGISRQSVVDLCGDCVLEMSEVAAAAAFALGLPPDAVERPDLDFSRTSVYVGDPCFTKVLALKHGVELTRFDVQVSDTRDFLIATANP